MKKSSAWLWSLSALLLASSSALADVAPGCSALEHTEKSPIAAGLLALAVGVGVLVWPKKRA